MSNYLTKPYEISLWKDGPSGEEKICTIGTDTMEGQNRAFEPIFSRNVNGVKKLSFKIYKKYVDIQTGEEVDNPYISYLISERKVKLHLPEEPIDNQWHDFIIKNVSENSTTHLCTYQLGDALVQELSKNGFGVTLDAKLMNNIGTANELADFVLRETDWDVSNDSEAFVQTIDEALVYLTFPQNPTTGLKVYKITGQKESNRKIGVTVNELDSLDDLKGKTILAFYSSCTGKPHRFQFLYSENGEYNTEEELKNYISNETDYQYYIDFDNPEDDYTVKRSNYTLPMGFDTTTYLEYENGTATTLSAKYRGRRYGFSQQAKYIPVLNRYVQLYKKGNQEYYGYEHAEYKSPALTQNMISNSTFESTSGWTGTKNSASGTKATVEAVYGYFNGDTFVNVIDELKNGTFNPKSVDNPNGKDYKAYLKLNFNSMDSTVINSGPFDNRTLIGNMVAGDEWALWSKAIGPGTLNFALGEYKYFPAMDGYNNISSEISFSDTIKTETKVNKTYSIYTVKTSTYSNESFKKNSNVRLQISASGPGEYYLEAIELFKVARCDNTIIPLEEQADSLEDRTVEKTYYYFTDEALKGIASADQLKPEATTKTLSYTTYKPVYNEGAQKVRTVTTKESNYFNILQSIAETFEAWLTFDIRRNNDGGIQERGKKITFKNYAGGDNYACFRYGVNLKDIQRTFESKNIVTKLIVKNNSNEHADGGFCTIQRASANPTGENYIYDFQYFFNQGLMNSRQYLDTLYVIDGAKGPDYKLWPNTDNTGYLIQKDTKDNIINLNGYFPRIKALNNKIQTESELLANIAQDLTKYKADLAVAEAGLDAATAGIEEVREDFLLLTGATIDMLSGHTIDSVKVGGKQDSEDAAKENGGWYYPDRDWIGSVSVTQLDNKSINATVEITGNTSNTERSLYIKVYPTISLSKKGNTATLSQYYNIKCTIAPNATSGSCSVDIEIVDSSRNDVQKKLQEYAVYVANENKYIPEKATLQTQIDALEAQHNEKQNYIENGLKEWKRQLNQLFFQTYSRFIQEGTWINEEYVDDGLYYADAQSVMYNSCYPQVAYTINVISVEGLPGYEDFKYKLGEKTWVVDPDFFGDEDREPVIITEIVENLDDRSKNQIKVQNFKNQFQDLFQKITATVQQAQYSTGSYEKAVALAEANQERKQQFLTEALDSASARLTTAGQQSVTWGNDGITVKSVNSPNDAIRMVGGAILLSKQDENGEQKWVTGVTSDGVSASLITAGVLNAGEISIMNYDEPVFRWDTFGISAYDATWYNGDTNIGTVISGVNTKKFVRFDKHGIYGINDAGVDGANWYPTGAEYDNDPFKEIDAKATFALTWEGLKVTNNYINNGETKTAIARIGNYIDTKGRSSIIRVNDGIADTFIVESEGNVFIKGHIEATSGKIGTMEVNTVANSAQNFIGKNLLKNSKTLEGVGYSGDISPVKETGFNGLTSNNEGVPLPTTQNQYPHKDILYFDNIQIERGKKYTLSFWAKGKSTSGNSGHYFHIFFYGPGEYLPCIKTETSWGEINTNADGHAFLPFEKLTEEYQFYWITWTIGQGTKDNNLMKHILWRLHRDDDSIQEVTVYGPKLEKGEVATPWSPADEDYMQSNQSNDFSWKFSPTEGMFMWNGQQHSDTDLDASGNKYGPTRGAVLAVYNDNGTHKLAVKGHVEADSGKIGNWNVGTIAANEHWSEGDATTGATQYNYSGVLFAKHSNPDQSHVIMYFRPNATNTSHLMAVRRKTPGKDQSKVELDGAGSVETIFAIDGNGKMIAKNADISGIIDAKSGGNIAGWKITDEGISCNNMMISDDNTKGIIFYNNNNKMMMKINFSSFIIYYSKSNQAIKLDQPDPSYYGLRYLVKYATIDNKDLFMPLFIEGSTVDIG